MMLRILQNYLTGMVAYDRCHQTDVRSQWLALKDEVEEFALKPSFDEIWDILHSAGRLIWKVTRIPLHFLAWPTVRKHSMRFAEYGCIRSRRNCEGKCCENRELGMGNR